jgi:hypothetical protein
MIEYGLLGALMAVSIATALTLMGTNLSASLYAVAANLEQPVRVMRVAPFSAPAVSTRFPSPRKANPSALDWLEQEQ